MVLSFITDPKDSLEMQKILISSCLIGFQVRYHGGDARCNHPLLQQWLLEDRLIPVCPEVLGGATVPRPPAEIVGIGGGKAVLEKRACIRTNTGVDETDLFVSGAQLTLALVKKHRVKIAILKERSPSCGSTTIYDGSFTGKTLIEVGVAAALLIQNGVIVFNEHQLNEAQDYLYEIEAEEDRTQTPSELAAFAYVPFASAL